MHQLLFHKTQNRAQSGGDTLQQLQAAYDEQKLSRDANVEDLYNLSGKADRSEYRFRLYTLGDKHIFFRETES